MLLIYMFNMLISEHPAPDYVWEIAAQKSIK